MWGAQTWRREWGVIFLSIFAWVVYRWRARATEERNMGRPRLDRKRTDVFHPVFKGSALRGSYRASKVWRTGEGRITPEVASDRLTNLKRTRSCYLSLLACATACVPSRWSRRNERDRPEPSDRLYGTPVEQVTESLLTQVALV